MINQILIDHENAAGLLLRRRFKRVFILFLSDLFLCLAHVEDLHCGFIKLSLNVDYILDLTLVFKNLFYLPKQVLFQLVAIFNVANDSARILVIN